jgi:hypothetical protein
VEALEATLEQRPGLRDRSQREQVALHLGLHGRHEGPVPILYDRDIAIVLALEQPG